MLVEELDHDLSKLILNLPGELLVQTLHEALQCLATLVELYIAAAVEPMVDDSDDDLTVELFPFFARRLDQQLISLLKNLPLSPE